MIDPADQMRPAIDIEDYRRHFRSARFAAIDPTQLNSVLGPGFYGAFEFAAVGMVVVDLEGRCMAANMELCKILQCSESDVLGEGFHAFTHPDDIPENLRLGEQLLSGQIPSFRYEKRYIQKTGSVIWVLLSASLVRDADGKPVCVISQIQDIDNLKRAQADLRESEERYRGIVEDQTELISRFRIDGILTYVNDAYCHYYGRARNELLGHSLLEHLPENMRASLLEHFKELAFTAGSSRNEHQTIAAGGVMRWLEWTNRALRDGQSVVTTIQGVGRDITERKAAEAAERAQHDLAEALRDSAAALNSTLNVERVLDRILANADRVAPHDASNVMLIDRETNEVYVVRQRGYTERGQEEWIKQLRLSLDVNSDFLHMAQSGQPLVIADITKHPTWITLPGSSWLRSYAAAPITIRGQTIGFLNFDSATPGFFNEAHINRLRAFADQAGVAIENARLFESSRHKEAHMTQLHEAGMALAQADSVAALYQLIVRWACTLVDTHLSALTLYDGASHLIVVAQVGFEDDAIGARIALGKGLAGRVAQAREPAQTQNYADFGDRLPYYRDHGLTSVAIIPLIWQDRLIGTIGVGDAGKVVFDEDDMHMLGLYASLIAAAIDQRRATEELEAREAEAQALSVRVLHAQEEERLRIAAQLHDAIGFRLVELEKTTEAAIASMGLDPPNARRMLDALELLRETQTITQRLSVDLSTRALAELGLSAAVRQYIDRLKTITSSNIYLQVAGRVKRLPATVETVAYRGLQEAIINALRHAHANKINIRMHFGAKQLRMTIDDNGRGFDSESWRGATKGTSLGLPELRRQVESLQGDFALRSAAGLGTRIEFGLPFQPVDQQPPGVKTRVVLADHQEVTRNGLRMLLAQSDDFTCVGEAGDGLTAIHQVELHHPDLVVMDIDLPNLSGAEVVHQITKRFPAVIVLILAAGGNEILLQSAFKEGARGYLLKTDPGQEIIKGLRLARDGDISISPALMDAWGRLQSKHPLGDPLQSLTLREREVLELIVAGNTNRKIGLRLGISFRTVEVHRKKVMTKLGARSLAQLMKSINGKLDNGSTD